MTPLKPPASFFKNQLLGGEALKFGNGNRNRDRNDQDVEITRTNSDVAIIGTTDTDHVGQKGGEGLLTPIGSDARTEGGDNNAQSWGYRSNLAPLACWKIDARAAACNDEHVDLSFDSVAFDVVVDFSSQRQER